MARCTRRFPYIRRGVSIQRYLIVNWTLAKCDNFKSFYGNNIPREKNESARIFSVIRRHRSLVYWTERFLTGTARARSAVDRLARWAPNLSDLVRWRYAAGQIVDGGQDFGFIISKSDIDIPGFQAQQLLVERKDFLGTQEFVSHVYDGTRTYDAASATYIFQDEANQENARWQWDETNQIYNNADFEGRCLIWKTL